MIVHNLMSILQSLAATLKAVVVATIGAIFIFLAALSVIELSSRISAKHFVLGKIDRIEKVATSFERNSNSDQTDENQVFRSYLYKDEIESLRVILDDLEHLNVTGAETPRQTVHAIRQRMAERSLAESTRLANDEQRRQVINLERELASLRSLEAEQRAIFDALVVRFEEETVAGVGPNAEEIEANAINARDSLGETTKNIASISSRIASIKNERAEAELRVTQWSPSIFVSLNPFLYLSSDLVLAISVILCGGIGALFTTSRSRSPKYAKSIFNGLMAGFVAFLVIKGGRFLFLIEASSDTSAFLNPFAAAFAGILSGLFTEKAYRILSDVTDQIGERVVSAESKGN